MPPISPTPPLTPPTPPTNPTPTPPTRPTPIESGPAHPGIGAPTIPELPKSGVRACWPGRESRTIPPWPLAAEVCIEAGTETGIEADVEKLDTLDTESLLPLPLPVIGEVVVGFGVMGEATEAETEAEIEEEAER